MRALLVDAGVIVKEIPNQPRMPYIKIAFPKTLKCSMVEKALDIANTDELTLREFRYSFTEEEYDVYTQNTKIIPTFLFGNNNQHGWGDAIKLPDDYKQRIQEVLYEFKPWLSKILAGQEVSDGALDTVIDLMATRIKQEICL